MAVVPQSAAIVNALRSGLVPNVGLEHFATGLDALVEAVNEDLDFVAGGKGLSKWIRGEYGTGRTFAARYLCAKARERQFATSEVQISINDTPLHHLETVYRRLIEKLETAADGPVTRDGGASFEVLRNGLPQRDAFDIVYRHGLDIGADGAHLAAGSTTGRLWTSNDGGASWRDRRKRNCRRSTRSGSCKDQLREPARTRGGK